LSLFFYFLFSRYIEKLLFIIASWQDYGAVLKILQGR
jgi:hypothetical protein